MFRALTRHLLGMIRDPPRATRTERKRAGVSKEQQLHTAQKKSSFTQRVVNVWNSPPQEVAAAAIRIGRRGLEKHLEKRSISGC